MAVTMRVTSNIHTYKMKTKFVRDFLPSEAHTLRFINADLIASGLAPFNPESAAFKAGLKNFNQHDHYAVDSWMLYDHSGMTPKLLDWRDI